jgi:VCBS repeat-containing protein
VVNFGFKVDQIPSGQLNYKDDEQDIHLVSDSIDSYSYDPSTNQLTFSGRGHVDRDIVFFTVTVKDNGEPGTSDTFSISITGSRTSSRSGTLSKGNIQFHR